MNNVYPLIQPQPASPDAVGLTHARILGTQGQDFLTDVPEHLVVQRAFSCLLDPQISDLVLLAPGQGSEPAYILAILQRTDPSQANLALPGGTQLHANESGLRLQAKNLHLDSTESIALHSKQLDINAINAQTTIKHWQGWFDTLQAHAVSIQYGAKTLSASLGRLISRSIESFRSVQGLDETRAGRSSTTVQEHHQLQAGHITARADGFVKIDGQKIDLG